MRARNTMRFVAVAGLLLFVYFFFRQGPLDVLGTIRQLTWGGAVYVLLLRAAYWLVRSVNWKIVCNGFNHRLPLIRFVLTRLAGNAVAFFTPLTQLGGDAVRVAILDKSDRKIVLASAVLEKTIEIMATALLIICGVVWALPVLALNGSQRILAISAGIFLATAMVFIFIKQKGSFFIGIIGILRKFHIRLPFVERRMDKIAETDRHIADFYANRKPRFLFVFIMNLILVAIWVMEIHIILQFISPKPVPFMSSFLLVTFGSAVMAIPALPAAFGTYEITYISLFPLLGIPMKAGLALLVIRRLFGLFWALVGLGPLLKFAGGTPFYKKSGPEPAPGGRPGSLPRRKLDLRRIPVVILAAGEGSRMRSSGVDFPKSLIPVEGVPILSRIIGSFTEVGFRDFHIVTGFQKEALEDYAGRESDARIRLTLHHASKWKKGNGMSLQSLAGVIEGKFVLSMSDHLFFPSPFRDFKRVGPFHDEFSYLFVDSQISEIADLDDATKVDVDEKGQIRRIGKTIAPYNRIDTGMFILDGEIFRALEMAFKERQEYSLSAGIQWLADRGLMRTLEYHGTWIDVDGMERIEDLHRVLNGTP